MLPLFLGDRELTQNAPCYVIAEIGVNHNGSVERAEDMVRAASEAGADAVKFQTFRADTMVVDGPPEALHRWAGMSPVGQRERLQALELDAAAWQRLRRLCNMLDLGFLSTALDPDSLEDVLALEPVCLKWPSGEIINLPFLRKAAASKLPLLMSTGMATALEVRQSVTSARAAGVDQLILLQCVSDHPARLEDQNLRVLPAWAKEFHISTGFSDHTIGPVAALAARALGALVIEKHFTLDCDLPGPDQAASTEPQDFANMVNLLRDLEKTLGDGVKAPVAAELGVAEVARKSLVYAYSLPKGHVLSEADLTSMRPGSGMGPDQIDRLLGRRLQHRVDAGAQAQPTHVR
ncbi:MAG: N-acetylneuraminate synthase family protein [Pseudomonadota bacterium]